jgi:twitching motility protein PilT
MPTLYELLKLMIDRGASDLHLTTGSPPRLRVTGKLVSLENFPSLSPDDTRELCMSVLTEAQKAAFEQHNELDFSFGIMGLSRFRANIFIQRGTVAGAFRAIPFKIKTFKDLGLPKIVEDLIRKPHGLILVTGPTGSGKSTTLASLIDRINTEREAHILTIEDPIEFLHSHKKCIINQREINSDTFSFQNALQYILRQDPDVVMIGEMQELRTIEAAITVSETRHLTLGTLHTNTALQTIVRIIDAFPVHHQEQARIQLSAVIEGILSQQLIPRQDGEGRVLALEILIPTPAIRNLIREDKLSQIYSIMQAGHGRSGMKTMNQSLHELHSQGLISYDEAITHSPAPEEMAQILTRGTTQSALRFPR